MAEQKLLWRTRDASDLVPPNREPSRSALEGVVRRILAEVDGEIRDLVFGRELYEVLGRPETFALHPVRTDERIDEIFGAHCVAVGLADG